MTSNAPSRERAKHVDAIEAPRVDATAFRQGWRVRTRLDGLLTDGRIDYGVWQCASDFRDAWSSVYASGGGGFSQRTSGGANPHDRTIAKLATLDDLRTVENSVGRVTITLCMACVCHDASWASTGRLFNRDAETIRTWTADALIALAHAWAARRLRPRSAGRDRA